LNIFMGYAGQASFGQNAFAAIGGYTSAVLTTAYGVAPIPALVVGVRQGVSSLTSGPGPQDLFS
jgi:branched-chain amino acid transport system permease protein